MERVWREEQEREDYRAGVIAALIANLFRGRDAPPAEPGDFMPFLRKPKTPPTPEQCNALLRAAVLAFGGEIRE